VAVLQKCADADVFCVNFLADCRFKGGNNFTHGRRSVSGTSRALLKCHVWGDLL
jgi:hypothetical protein